jgi:hypothetical protein
MVAMKDIRAFARRIAAEFKPRRIILFGSYAYGKPTEDSDRGIALREMRARKSPSLDGVCFHAQQCARST